jgi:ribosome-associated toxin RatA of RatAB toxin-antitoxin module
VLRLNQPRMSSAMSRILAALLCCTALATAPAAAQAGAPIPSENVKKGGMDSTALPFPGTSVQWGRAVMILDAPAERVMSIVGNYADYHTFLPNFTTSRVLSQRGSSALVYVQLEIMNGAATIWAELKLRPKKTDGTTQIIEGTMTKGNVKLFQAQWEVTPQADGRTLVAVQMIVDPDLPVPSSILTSENQKSARKTMRALRDKLAAQKPAK